MSFKRDGDNPDLLGNLRKRRVQELFAENIPEDEAFLMRSGRFACTVCHHRPVFDTVAMLAVHRQGKKHHASVHYHQQKKKELQELILKRKHDQFVKDGTTDIDMPTSQSGGLLGACRYDPRSKRSKVKPHERKVRLNLGDVSSDDQTKDQHKPSLPGYSKTLYEQPGPLIHSHRLKDVFGDGGTQSNKPTVTPYISKHTGVPRSSHPNIQQTMSGSHYGHGMSNNTQVFQGGSVSITKLAPPPPPPSEPCQETSDRTGKKHQGQRGIKVKSQTDVPSAVTEKQMKAEQYLKLTESGWKRDRGGNWVRDENVEFDSDEETPTLQ